MHDSVSLSTQTGKAASAQVKTDRSRDCSGNAAALRYADLPRHCLPRQDRDRQHICAADPRLNTVAGDRDTLNG